MSNVPGTRLAMAHYWQSYEPTLESMMLDSNAKSLTEEEQAEILSYLPDYRNKVVLELGAGIGRYTGELALTAQKVVAVDFIQEFVDKNEEANGHLGNIDFLQGDVTQLALPQKSYDIIFTNWLLMYLDDDEVRLLVENMLSWLKDDGFLFVRESCFHPSGKGVSRPSHNPTFYRDPSEYTKTLQSEIRDEIEHISFQLIKASSVKTYVKYKNNPNQLCYLLQKVTMSKADSSSYHSFQAFLDENQYTRQGILRYERIFGNTFVSTGGLETTKEFCDYLNLKAGENVLDVGCGIGGSAFYMAKNFNVSVAGVDLSANMISVALQKQNQELETNKVCFEISDITKSSYPDQSFDVIYSRDTLLHIDDKKTLFANFLKWLKPGGRLLISDYCRGPRNPYSQEFVEYVAKRGYHLLTVEDYGLLLESVGFSNVKAEDRTNQFVHILETELERFAKGKESFLKDFSEEDYVYIEDGWNGKIKRCRAKDQAWGLFIATKQ